MQFLAITTINPTSASTPPAELAQSMEEEIAHTRQCYADGLMRQIWVKHDMTGAVGILEAESLKAVAELLEAFPLAKANHIDVQIIPLDPYPPFAAPAVSRPASA